MTSSHRQALGRGLSALIPQTAKPGAGIDMVDIDLITPNPQQPRMQFAPEALAELAESIREHGVLQPVIVTRVASEFGPPTYQLIAGERRVQAARIAGLTHMPVIVREATDADLLALALVENIQRQDLNPLEEAVAFARLQDEFKLTQDEIAKLVGRGRAAVGNAIRLLSLPEEIRTSMASGQISEGHARTLLSIDDAQARMDLWRKIIGDALNVRQAETIAQALRPVRRAPSRPASNAQPIDPELRALEEDLRHALSAKVQIAPSGAGGRVVITYHGDDELTAIVERIVGARRY